MVCPYVQDKDEASFHRKMFMSLGSSDKLLTICGSEGLSSLVILDTHDLMPLFRVDSDSLSAMTKKSSPLQKGVSMAKSGILYPTSSPYHKASDDSRIHSVEVEEIARTDKLAPSRSSGADKSAPIPVVGMRYVSDWNGLGDYLIIVSQKQILVVSFGDSSLIGSVLTTRRNVRASHIPRFSSPGPDAAAASAANSSEAQTPSRVAEGSLLPIIKTIFNNAWAQRTVRKIHNNDDAKANATIAWYDPKNNLVFLAGTATQGSANWKGPSPVFSVLRVIGVNLKRSKVIDDSDDKGAGESASPSRLSMNLSMPQQFSFPAGEVTYPLAAIGFSASSGRLITAGVSGTVAIWRLASEYVLDTFRQTLAAATPSWTNRLGSVSETLKGTATHSLPNGALLDDFEAEAELDSNYSFIDPKRTDSKNTGTKIASKVIPKITLSDSLNANRGLQIDSRVNISMGVSENQAFSRHEIPRSPLQRKFSADISSPQRATALDTAGSTLESSIETPKHRTSIPTPTRTRRREVQGDKTPSAATAPAVPASPPRSAARAAPNADGTQSQRKTDVGTIQLSPKVPSKPAFSLQESFKAKRSTSPILSEGFVDDADEPHISTQSVLASPGIAVMKMDELVQATDEAMESVPEDKNCYEEFSMGKWIGKRGRFSREIASSSVFDGTTNALDFGDFKREPSDILSTPPDTAQLQMTLLSQRFGGKFHSSICIVTYISSPTFCIFFSSSNSLSRAKATCLLGF
jgi:hypothetical protein